MAKFANCLLTIGTALFAVVGAYAQPSPNASLVVSKQTANLQGFDPNKLDNLAKAISNTGETTFVSRASNGGIRLNRIEPVLGMSLVGDPEIIREIEKEPSLLKPSKYSSLASGKISLFRDWVQTVEPGRAPGVKNPRVGPTPKIPEGCAVAQMLFNSKVEHGLNRILTGGGLPANLSRPEFEAISADFDTKCLAKADAISQNLTKPTLSGVAVILNQYGQPFCSAIYLGDKKFATAHHCLTAQFDSATAVQIFGMNPQEGHELFAITNKSPPAPKTANPYDDFAIFSIATMPSGLGDYNLKTHKPVVGEQLAVVGLYRLYNPTTALASAESGLSTSDGKWREGIRATAPISDGYCRTVDFSSVDDTGHGCLIHSCQTLKGFSGAPTFSKSANGEWGLLGVNVSHGDTDSLEKCGALKNSESKSGYSFQQTAISARIP